MRKIGLPYDHIGRSVHAGGKSFPDQYPVVVCVGHGQHLPIGRDRIGSLHALICDTWVRPGVIGLAEHVYRGVSAEIAGRIRGSEACRQIGMGCGYLAGVEFHHAIIQRTGADTVRIGDKEPVAGICKAAYATQNLPAGSGAAARKGGLPNGRPGRLPINESLCPKSKG